MKKHFIKIRLLIFFLAFALVFTIASRMAASVTVAQVLTEETRARKIRHTVTASGQIEAKQQFAVVTQPDLLVSRVWVKPGEQVEEGDVLISIDAGSLADKIDAIRDEISALQLQNESLENQDELKKQNQAMQVQRAGEDYRDADNSSKASVAGAAASVDQANAQYASAQQELQDAIDAAARCQEELKAAKQTEEQCRIELEAAQKAYEERSNQRPKDAEENASQGTEETSGYFNNQSGQDLKDAIENAQQALGEAEAQVAEKEAQLLTYNNSVEAKQAAVSSAEQSIQSAKEDYAAAEQSASAALKSAQRALEDAKTPVPTDPSADINSISIREKENLLDKYLELEAQEGKVMAPQAGTVSGMNIEPGQRTSDTAFATLSDHSLGQQLTVQISKEDAEYVNVGDTASLSGLGGKEDDCMIRAVQSDEDETSYFVTADIASDLFQLGESVTLTIDKDSQQYPCTVPLAALMQENNRTYVLILDTENTVLGEQYVARKTEVTVLDKNTSFAALDASSLPEHAKVIVDADRYVESGSRVRLMDKDEK